MRKILLLFIVLNLCGFAAEKINYSDIKYAKGKYYNENGIMNGEYEVVFDKAETKTYESVMDGRKFEYKVLSGMSTFVNGNINSNLASAIYDESRNPIIVKKVEGDFVVSYVYNNNKLFEMISREKVNFFESMLFSEKYDGIVSGPYKTYYENENVKEEGVLKTHRTVLSCSYNTCQVKYSGEKNGIVKRYYESGKLESETEYKVGEKNGYTRYYDESGNLTKTEKYSKGVLKKTI